MRLDVSCARGDSVAAAARDIDLLDALKLNGASGSCLSHSTSATRPRSGSPAAASARAAALISESIGIPSQV
jgi:hypothetical protein